MGGEVSEEIFTTGKASIFFLLAFLLGEAGAGVENSRGGGLLDRRCFLLFVGSSCSPSSSRVLEWDVLEGWLVSAFFRRTTSVHPLSVSLFFSVAAMGGATGAPRIFGFSPVLSK